jgi:hypothetical protein
MLIYNRLRDLERSNTIGWPRAPSLFRAAEPVMFAGRRLHRVSASDGRLVKGDFTNKS